MRGLQISTAKRDCFNPLTHSEYPNHHAHRISGPRSQVCRLALRLGSSTLACSQTYGLLSDSGLRPSLVLKPTVCSPLRASSPRLFSNQRFDRKPSVCLAEVVCFASNPPPLRPPLRGSPRSQTYGLLSDSGLRPSLDGSPRLRAGSQTILKASFI